MGLTSHVGTFTHKAGHALDQVYTLLNNQVEVISCHQDLLLSDHFVIEIKECLASIPISPEATKRVISRKLSDVNATAFMEDFNCKALDLTNVDDAVKTLNAELVRVLDKHAPLRERHGTDVKRKTWYDEHAKHQMKFVRSRFRVWQKYREQHQWKAYTVERYRLNRMIEGTKMRSISSKVEECASDTESYTDW